MDEIWKPIGGFEYYEISNLGRVKAKKRKVPSNSGNYRWQHERIMSQGAKAPYNYRSVGLRKNGVTFNKYVHHLVYEAFIGERISGMQIDHIDNDRGNNSVSNLQQVTPRENRTKDQFRYDRASKYIGVTYSPHKLKRKWCAYIRFGGKKHFIGSFENEADAGEAYLAVRNDPSKKWDYRLRKGKNQKVD